MLLGDAPRDDGGLTMTEVLMALALAGNGVAVGVFAGTVLGGVPLLLALPPDRYVHAHGFLATRYDPFMPVTLALTALLDITLAIVHRDWVVAPIYLLAGLLVIAVMVVSVTRTVPINKWVTAQDPARMPDDWERHDPRERWRTWNLVRSSLAAAALLVNLVALITASLV
jgi:uncharacterized membrane protein